MALSAYKDLPTDFKLILNLLLLLFAMTCSALAQQQGASSAAASRARYLSEIGSLPASREIAVEEFVNYHRHQIGSPKAGEAVRKNYRKDATNRLILLTDGIANRGETDPAKIAQDSLRFNDQGIDLSTIGVGLDLNKDLLRELAKSGRGLFHFVADAEDIEKVFIKEVQSLVSPVAYEPNLDIDYDPALELEQIYGYEPQFRKSGVKIKLDNMNHGLTQVVLLRFQLAKKRATPASLSVNVRLSYYDPEQKEQVLKIQESYLMAKDGPPGDMLKDPEVGKNYSIAQLAQAIRDMAAACEARRYQEAENLLASVIDKTYRRYPHLEDEDITRTLTMAQKYRSRLKKYNHQWDALSDR